ncbi:putative bifunctional diguanylate cyclase/phosphodiesterase [Sulfuricurvum sp.]|uniref:putative bifunctional diguanylate cyclase/phosphodiesterase n=1 Tax=Sulfuricurvum sp. TaxID=2025608 RepID=UPI003C4DC9B4
MSNLNNRAKKLPKNSQQKLRQHAEKILIKKAEPPLEPLSLEETQKILHELRVHQIELEMQNDELTRAQIVMTALQEDYRDLYDFAPVGYCTLNPKGVIVQANTTAASLLGVTRNTLLQQSISKFILKEDQDVFYLFRKKTVNSQVQQSCELRMHHLDGRLLWMHLSATSTTSSFRLVLSDITRIKEYQRKLEHIAYYDVLTKLPNRTLFADRLHQAMKQALRHTQPLAIIYLDLDGFKRINDAHGHDVGDQFLIRISEHIQETMREGDTLARIGGDEFVVVLPDLASIKECIPTLDRLLKAASKEVYIDELVLNVSASLGITFYPQSEAVDADQLLRQADYAMYQAKLAGKNRYFVFDTAQNGIIRELYEIIARIQKGMDTHEFILYYQPKVNMRTGEIIGVEALIRWLHPEKGIINPLDFLPKIEDHPLIVEIGEWVIDTVLTQMEEWHVIGLDFPVSVNISAKQLQQNNFLERLREILSRHMDISPSKLEFEVLETSKLEDLIRISDIIKACSVLGIHFALDDFGTGYSSLTYLKHLPVSVLKIDQSFIRGMLDNPDDLSILKGVIGLASAFHRQVIAEGVETIEHGKILMEMGCDLAQGYAISPPIPANQVLHWSHVWKSDPVWRD